MAIDKSLRDRKLVCIRQKIELNPITRQGYVSSIKFVDWQGKEVDLSDNIIFCLEMRSSDIFQNLTPFDLELVHEDVVPSRRYYISKEFPLRYMRDRLLIDWFRFLNWIEPRIVLTAVVWGFAYVEPYNKPSFKDIFNKPKR
jgi:hypothetical protein